MHRTYLILLLGTLLGSGSYFYYAYTPVCLVPMTYRLGTLDVRFNLTEDAAKNYLAEAAEVWDETTEEDLFVYDENSDFPVNFIFDDRQERTIAEEAQRESLDEKETTSAEVAAEYKKLTEEYNPLRSALEADTAAYESRLAAFNAKVASYNQSGGAPASEFAKLKVEEKYLTTRADALEVRADNLAVLAERINELSEKGNRLIEQYNAGVAEYNHAFAAADEFTQGDYKGTDINIYKFSSDSELLRVLTHEFGHALGLGHVEGSSSIMYYLMEKQPEAPVLTAEDRAAFAAICTEKQGIINWFYRIIHNVVTKF